MVKGSTVKRLTEERKRLTEEVAAGHTPAEVACKNGCSISRVIHSCHEFGVETPHSRVRLQTVDALAILAKLQNGEETLTEIADSLRLAYPKIVYVYKQAKKAGLAFSPRRVGRPRKS